MKQEIRSRGTINSGNSYLKFFKNILKNPSFILYILIITLIISNLKGFHIQRFIMQLIPVSPQLLDIVLEVVFGIALLSISLYLARKYLIVHEKKVKTEEQFESVVNSIKEVVFQTDTNGLWTFLNPAWTEVTGFGVEESLGKNFIEFVYPEDRDRNLELFKPLIERKKDYCRHEIRYISKNSGYCWVEVFAQLIVDEDGDISGTSGTLMDITQRKEMEQAISDREKILLGVADATAILLKNVEIDKALHSVLEVLGKATEAERAYIFQNFTDEITQKCLVSQKYEWCNIGIIPQINNEDLQNVSYEDMGLMRWYHTLSEGREISGLVKDFPDGERAMLEPQYIKTLVVVPIFVDNFFWGFIGFDCCTKERIWTNSEIALLFAAAASIGGAIKRISDEQQIQSLLKSDLKQTVQNLQNLVFKCKKNSENKIYFTLFEGKLAEKIGLTTDIVYGEDICNILEQKNQREVIDNFFNAFEGIVCNFEMQLDGCIYYTSLSPLVNKGVVKEIVGSAIEITELKMAQEQIHYMAYYDTLTGLPNRAFFKKQLGYLLSQANRNNTIMAIMYLDLDRFKLVNDTLGHIAGDELLKATANRLKKVVKNNDILIRMGGDEFIIVFPQVRLRGEISKLAQSIIDAFKSPFNVSGHEIYISTSIGISLYPYDGTDIDLLIKNADTAMYRSKENGSNSYQFYTEDMHKRALERLEIENCLRKALGKCELSIVYQPRFNIRTGYIVGAEALVRWNHPVLGSISPSIFIPIAEETGIIHDIGKWVLYNACKQTYYWYNNVDTDFQISVNISAIQFQRDDLVDIVKKVLSDTGLKATMLELEVTENTIMQKTEKTLNNIKELKEIGVKISIDDFGTGFSSLSYMKEFHFDNLKIDKSFIQDIGVSYSNESIISAIISMAHSMGMTVVAEGVETEYQLDFLITRNCDEVQGYLFSAPLSTEEFVFTYLCNDIIYKEA